MKKEPLKTPMELHVEQFGVKPIITGVNAMGEKSMDELIIDALEKGEPYVEPAPKKGAVY